MGKPKKKFKKMSKERERQLWAKYEAGILSIAERNEWWPYRLKQMRDEYYKKR